MSRSPQKQRGNMFRTRSSALLIMTALALPLALLAAGRSTTKSAPSSATDQQQKTKEVLSGLPVVFEPNRGQTDPSVSYLSHVGNTRLFLTRDSTVFVLQPSQKTSSGKLPAASVVRMRTVNSRRGSLDEGVEQLPGHSNYLIGRDSSKWVTDVPQFAKVKRQSVYPGIDMVFYGNHRQLEYDFMVGPGADPSRIELAFDGVDKIRTTPAGDLVLTTLAGDFIQRKPKVYQRINGHQVEVAAHYRVSAGNTVQFAVARYDRRQPLVIDPTIVFNAIIGSGSNDIARNAGIAVDVNQSIFVSGESLGADFPLANGYSTTFQGSQKIFVFKLNSTATTLIYSTYIGGEMNDYNIGVRVDSSGNAIVAGSSYSSQYPVVAAAQGTNAGNLDGVISKLNFSGNALLFSTFLGGPNADQIQGLAMDSVGSTYVTGLAAASFPVTSGASQAGFGGGTDDCILAKYNSSGALQYATYLGGSDVDACFAVAADSTGNAYVTGGTQSVSFPVTAGAFQTTNASLNPNTGLAPTPDAFFAKFNPSGTRVYSTFLGGNSGDVGTAIALDSLGSAYIGGYTYSKNLPTTAGAFQALPVTFDTNIYVGFVSKFSPSGALSYSTYLSGSSGDTVLGIAADSSGVVYVVGQTFSANFPVLAPLIGTKPGLAADSAGFASVLNNSGSGLVSSTFLGGNGLSASPDDKQSAKAVAVDSSGNFYVVGQTDSSYYKNATPGALNAGYGGADIFVTKISPTPSAGCTISTGPSSLFAYGASATNFPIEVFAPSGCAWTASTVASWISFPNGASATGTAGLGVVVAANAGAARTANITFNVGGTLTVTQAAGGCSYGFSSSDGSVVAAGGSGTASLTADSGCTWNAVSSEPWLTLSSASGTSNGSISYTAAVNTSGTLPARKAKITVGTAVFTVTQATPCVTNCGGGPAPHTPSAVSVSPSTGFGSNQSYTFQFADTSGASDLTVVDVLINTSLDGRNACYLAYVASANTVYLLADLGNGTYAGTLALNGSGSLSNSQCTINGAGSSASSSGNTLTLTLNMSFSSGFSGNRVIYMSAGDTAGSNTGWQTLGVHGLTPQVSSFPNPSAMTPPSGSVSNSTISYTYLDASSAANLQTVWALINTAIDGRAACYVAYYRPANLVLLIPDSGDGSQATSMPLSGTGTLSNSQCTISAQGSSVSTSGNQLVVTLNVTFKSGAFTGPKGVWLAASTLSNQVGPWQALGVWRVP